MSPFAVTINRPVIVPNTPEITPVDTTKVKRLFACQYIPVQTKSYIRCFPGHGKRMSCAAEQWVSQLYDHRFPVVQPGEYKRGPTVYYKGTVWDVPP